ncbi:hypothetical protein FQR65_LT01051 [Abscondita terminalis]|nr:hypothetical protein FQR65_LT01051 [Abscondita terminalis]
MLFPFYYEIKIILVVWLLSPATKGSSILYRKFVHPMLSKRENEIDEYIAKAKEQSYKQVLGLGSKGVNALMQTALKGGGGIVNQLRKSYSLSDLINSPLNPSHEESDDTDTLTESVTLKKKRVHHASTTSGIYFSEVDVRHDVAHVQSNEDLAYLSGDSLYSSKSQSKEVLTRSGSISSPRPRSLRVTRSTPVPKTTATSSNESNINESVVFKVDQNINNQRATQNIVCEKSDSSSEGEFVDPSESLISIPKGYIIGTSEKSSKEYLYRSSSFDSLPLTLNTKGSDMTKRAGKYNKRAAPPPPITRDEIENKELLKSIPAIKATLVLTPGANPKSSFNQKNIKNQLPSCKNSKNKQTSSLSRFMMLPKKLHFWHKGLTPPPNNNLYSQKRSSWYAELPKTAHLSLMELKPLSKSADNFYAINMQKPTSKKFEEDVDSD